MRMKFAVLAALVLLTGMAFGQTTTTYDIITQGGTITGPVYGSSPLTGTANVFSVFINGGLQPTEAGTVTFTTGRNSASLQVGTAFQSPGGSVVVTTQREGIIFRGEFSDTSHWTVSAGRGHFYRLFDTLDDNNVGLADSGLINLETEFDSSVTCFWNGSDLLGRGVLHLVITR